MPMDKKPCKKVLRRFNHSRIWILLNGGNDINTCYHSVYSLQSLPLNPMKWHHVLVTFIFCQMPASVAHAYSLTLAVITLTIHEILF